MFTFEAVNLKPCKIEGDSTRKRRREQDHDHDHEKIAKSETIKSSFDVQLHIETPLPSDWQRCLDIKSGQIHFYNTRTQKRTCKDPRSSSPEPPSHDQDMSLDLELNLVTRNSPKKIKPNNHISSNKFDNKISGLGLKRVPSWLAFDDDDKRKYEEMVATVCVRCHMLVMLCKSCPTCPNCKFVNPTLDQPGSPKMSSKNNSMLSLLC